MTSVNVTTTKNTVTVNGETRVVTVKTRGPQGPTLPDGDKGDVTVSSNGTAISINSSAVTSAKIADGAIVDADINASAAIALTKLATGALPTAITVTSANISDLSIVDADISASAAISLSKLATGALPTAITVTSANISDLSIVNADINASAAIAGTKISPDFGSQNIVTTGTAATGALGVTGNLTVSGTVDGVDVATRDALFGGLTSSSGVLSNGVTATTQSASDNSTKIATTAYTDTAISNLINGAPAALDTLNELAAALNDDAAFSTTVTNSIATKMPLAGGQFTGNVTFSGTQTVDGRDLSVDGAKLDGIESGATADQTAAEIRTLVESASDSNVFTDADHSKLNGIEASATADQTKSDIDALGIAASTATTLATARTIAGTSFDGSANIDISYTNLTNKLSVGDGGLTQNNFTDALKTKLDGVETGATADQTASEIKTAYESNSDTNAFTDADHTKLDGIEASATADQTAAEIKTLLDSNGIVNAQIDASAAIAGTKISPNFGSQNVATTGTLASGNITITSIQPFLSLQDSNNENDFEVGNAGGLFRIRDVDAAANRLTISSAGVTTIAGNLDVGAGIDVTGNITVTGTVDGVDIAALNTTVGNLSLSGSVLADGTTATTQSASDNSTKVATTAYTDTAIANLVNSAPSTLDTLGEIATALNNDAALNTTLTNSIATKLPLAGGTLTGDLTLTSAAPAINFVDDGDNPDYRIVTNSGQFKVQDTTNSNANRLLIQQANTRITNNLLADGGIDVTGNISVTGTVDGRDVASDGSKLDGIEASATADQTASEIVALVADQTIAPSEIDMEDNEKIQLGTGDDLEIYHDGSNSYIKDTGTGQLRLATNEFLITNAAVSENMFKIFENGAVELYYDASKKLETTNTGVEVDGNVQFPDGGEVKLGADGDLRMFHSGSQNYVQSYNDKTFRIQSFGTSAEIKLQTNESENNIICKPNGATELYYDNSKKFETYSNGVRAANNGHIKLASDSGKFFMGAGDDAELFHDGTNLTLNGDGTNATFLRAKSGENSIKLIPDGAVELYYDNGKKLETTSTGALIDGKLETTGLTRAGDITFERSGNTRLTVDNGGITVGGDIKYNDNYKIKAGTGADLEIYHDGSNSNIKSITNDLFIRSNSSDDKAIVVRNGAGVDLYYDNAKKLETTTNGITMSGHIDLPDQKEVRIGGASLRLRHDGHSIIQNDESGACMFITSHETQFANTGLTEAQAKFFQDGAVELFYDNGKKLETTSAGISVTGQVNSDGSHMGDNDKAIFGNSNDLQIYHDGSENAINMTDTNHDLRIFGVSGSSIKLEPRSGHSSAVFKSNNAVELYYDNDKKFETASIGVYSKSIMPSSHETYDIGQNMGRWNNIYIADSGKLRIGQGDDLQIYHNGSHSFIDDVGTGDMYIRGDNALKIQNAAGSEQKIVANSNGSVDLYYDGSKKLETTSSGVSIPSDTTFLHIGAGQDLDLHHNGTNSYIRNRTGDLHIRPLAAEEGIILKPNAAVELYYDNSKKFETTSAGVEVTGNVTFAGDSNTHISHPQADYLKITTGGNEVMSFTDASNIFVPDSRKLMFGNNVDLQIYHDGSNSWIRENGTGSLYIDSNGNALVLRGAQGEDSIVCNANGDVELYHDNSKKLETTSSGATVTGSLGVSNHLMVDGATGQHNGSSLNVVGSYGDDNSHTCARFSNSDDSQLLLLRSDKAFFSDSIYHGTTSSAANVVVESSGLVRRSTSSRDYKKNIKDASWGLADVLKLRPVTFQSNAKGEFADNHIYGGFISEELHESGLTEFVQYDENNKAEGIAYGHMVALLTNAIKELSAEVAALKGA